MEGRWFNHRKLKGDEGNQVISAHRSRSVRRRSSIPKLEQASRRNRTWRTRVNADRDLEDYRVENLEIADDSACWLRRAH